MILYNEINSATHCWARPVRGCLHAKRTTAVPATLTRSLFGFARKPKRRVKPVDFDPGYETLLQLDNRLKIGSRPHPPEELAQAFVEFFKSKDRDQQPLGDLQAQHALTAFEHLQETVNDGKGMLLSSDEIRLALKVLKNISKEYKMHNKLARALFSVLSKRREASINEEEPSIGLDQDLIPFITVLSQSGDALYARDLIERNWNNHLKDSHTSPWGPLYRGLIRERRGNELQKTVDIMQKHNVPFDAKVHQAITTYFAKEGEMEMTKTWYNHPISSGSAPTTHTVAFVLRLCIKRNDLEWGNKIFKSLMARGEEDRSSWNIILQWSAAIGKSVDEIERMMQVMVKRSQERGSDLRPDMDTINGLIELANSKNDPYTAERYLALGQKCGLQPNARTYLLQLDYRIKVGDLGGARTAYARLQGEEVSNQEDLPLINRLIVALYEQKPQNYDAIMGLVEDLTERKALFEPATVIALSNIHLQRNEMDDLVDLLNTHAFHYSLDERASIRDTLLNHCLDSSTPISRAWDTYNVFRQTFAETDIHIRTTLMNYFFSRGRPDMATHVFGHMRQQQIKSLRPTISTYAQCLAGLGRAGDHESLEIVHNMIKIDSEIEPNTQLYNALMIGYSGCGDSQRALGFWEDIVHSREGPSYASIQIALRACEGGPSGETAARDIWGRLQRYEIEVTREIYAAYVGALAGHDLFDECVELINGAQKETGYEPDTLL